MINALPCNSVDSVMETGKLANGEYLLKNGYIELKNSCPISDYGHVLFLFDKFNNLKGDIKEIIEFETEFSLIDDSIEENVKYYNFNSEKS